MGTEETEANPHIPRILVTGASGFIGGRLVEKLSSSRRYKIRCLTRRADTLKERFSGDDVEIAQGDAGNYYNLVDTLSGVDVAFYLIHSMEGSASGFAKFAGRDKLFAENFARAATECHVSRIIYLEELGTGRNEDLSHHMWSRRRVGDILAKSTAKLTVFRASSILGKGGHLFEMLRYLVEKLPLLLCPKWVLNKTQPISVDDVVTYLAESVASKETEGKIFDVGGPETLSFFEMIERYGRIKGKQTRVAVTPFRTPRLSAYWIDLVTPVKASIARPLIDALQHDATVRDNSIRQLIPIKLKSFEETVEAVTGEPEGKAKTTQIHQDKTLLYSLFALEVLMVPYVATTAFLGLSNIPWILAVAQWYLGVAFAIHFIDYGAKLGTLSAGIIGPLSITLWITSDIEQRRQLILITGATVLYNTLEIDLSILAAVLAAASVWALLKTKVTHTTTTELP